MLPHWVASYLEYPRLFIESLPRSDSEPDHEVSNLRRLLTMENAAGRIPSAHTAHPHQSGSECYASILSPAKLDFAIGLMNGERASALSGSPFPQGGPGRSLEKKTKAQVLW